MATYRLHCSFANPVSEVSWDHCVKLSLSSYCIRYNGYQYSMEWYFMEMLRNGPQYLARSQEEASVSRDG